MHDLEVSSIPFPPCPFHFLFNSFSLTEAVSSSPGEKEEQSLFKKSTPLLSNSELRNFTNFFSIQRMRGQGPGGAMLSCHTLQGAFKLHQLH